MIDYQRMYHVGIRVPNLEVAMAELGPALGVTWASPLDVIQPLWTPEDGLRQVPLKFVYSCEGPQHIELLQGAEGSPWYGNDAPGVHHVGIWCDDVPGEAHRLVGEGWTLRLAKAAPEDGYGSYVYVQPPSSAMLVELVDSGSIARFERWWAGGSLR
jgi:lactoylglutathione lyase